MYLSTTEPAERTVMQMPKCSGAHSTRLFRCGVLTRARPVLQKFYELPGGGGVLSVRPSPSNSTTRTFWNLSLVPVTIISKLSANKLFWPHGIWLQTTFLMGHWRKLALLLSVVTQHALILGRFASIWCVSTMTYNGRLRKWPDHMSLIKNQRYANYRYECVYRLMTVSNYSPSHCRCSTTTIFFLGGEVGWLGLSMWPDLRWPGTKCWQSADKMANRYVTGAHRNRFCAIDK